MKDTKNIHDKRPVSEKTGLRFHNSFGFTLTEIIIAMTISVLIMGGILGFLTKLQKDIILSKETTHIYTTLTDFIATMNNFGKLYGSGTIIVDGTGVYNIWLLMRPDKTSGVLIGVVEEVEWASSYKLDPVSNKNMYGEKVIAYRKLTASQVSSILASTGSVYDVDFLDEGLFKDLTVTDFSIIPYNSGKLFEYRFDVETPFYESLRGKSRSNIEPEVTTFSFTLDF